MVNRKCPPAIEAGKMVKKEWLKGEKVKRLKNLFAYFPIYLLTYICFQFLTLNFASASSYQDWMKKIGKQKVRKVHSKHTAVAAVRGVDEPGQVDKSARNYEAVAGMEKKTISQDKLIGFIKEGKLVLFGQDSAISGE